MNQTEYKRRCLLRDVTGHPRIVLDSLTRLVPFLRDISAHSRVSMRSPLWGPTVTAWCSHTDTAGRNRRERPLGKGGLQTEPLLLPKPQTQQCLVGLVRRRGTGPGRWLFRPVKGEVLAWIGGGAAGGLARLTVTAPLKCLFSLWDPCRACRLLHTSFLLFF